MGAFSSLGFWVLNFLGWSIMWLQMPISTEVYPHGVLNRLDVPRRLSKKFDRENFLPRNR
jgi:hypothetical protein